ncbi:hypothetical protein [Jeotgalibaca porci]|uniref:hypothetical protein n=1 Tax=Jeotgalibaca porci TaxID=1868793 RepID=UPI0035A012AA
MNDPQIFRKVKCGVCRKRVSTRLCDFVVAYDGVFFFRDYYTFKNKKNIKMCDLPMCGKCAIKHNGSYDFCPHHHKMLEMIKPTKEMAKSIGEYRSRELARQLGIDKEEPQ